MAKPFFSVLIDTCNHERFIEEAVQSVLAQDFTASGREILVVDDGSTDGTPAILKKFRPHVRVLWKPNGGQASAFNCGIPECQGEIVAFLDGDDWWAPNKLSTLAAAFSANAGVALVGHSITEVLADGTQRSELVRDVPRFQINSVDGARAFLLRKSFLGTSRMAFRRSLLQRIGPVPESLLIEADEFLFTLGAVFSEVLLLREPLTFYRLQGQNLYQISGRQEAPLRRKHGVLVALAAALHERLAKENVPEEIRNTIVDSALTEADVLRLALGEGTPLDTFRTELHAYDHSHGHASAGRRALKVLSLLPALLLPPRQYNALKRKLGSSFLYTRARKRMLPLHQPDHVDRTGKWNA
jgi:glycosyltransferase involved in cell wall biosynthesis